MRREACPESNGIQNVDAAYIFARQNVYEAYILGLQNVDAGRAARARAHILLILTGGISGNAEENRKNS